MPPQTETKMKLNRGFTAFRQRRRIAELIVLVEIESLEGRETAQRGQVEGSGANLLSIMYLSGERPCRFKRPGPRSKFSERWLLVRLVV
jgi:hypothetical protein